LQLLARKIIKTFKKQGNIILFLSTLKQKVLKHRYIYEESVRENGGGRNEKNLWKMVPVNGYQLPDNYKIEDLKYFTNLNIDIKIIANFAGQSIN
jgi:hypothetical protein